MLRAESVRGQLAGQIPATIRSQQDQPDSRVDASHVSLTDLGDFHDLESAKEKQDAALAAVVSQTP